MNRKKEAKELFGEMRGFTQEESDEYEAALDRLSEPTGINFYDLLEENKKSEE